MRLLLPGGGGAPEARSSLSAGHCDAMWSTSASSIPVCDTSSTVSVGSRAAASRSPKDVSAHRPPLTVP